MLPGGRVNYSESSKDAIKREILKGLEINSEYNLICIEENFLLNKKTLKYKIYLSYWN